MDNVLSYRHPWGKLTEARHQPPTTQSHPIHPGYNIGSAQATPRGITGFLDYLKVSFDLIHGKTRQGTRIFVEQVSWQTNPAVSCNPSIFYVDMCP